jgi:hypothetical protein
MTTVYSSTRLRGNDDSDTLFYTVISDEEKIARMHKRRASFMVFGPECPLSVFTAV